jgi:hypothetical protein
MSRNCILALICASAILVSGQSCTTTVDPGNDGGNNGGGGGGGTSVVTVRLVNASPSAAVDVQLYATPNSISNPDTELFIPGNQQLASIGFAGSGILQPNQTDEVQISCANALFIGTTGGAFLNVDTGAVLGTGTRYFLVQGGQFQCGSTITLTYLPSGSGYRTDVAVAGPG